MVPAPLSLKNLSFNPRMRPDHGCCECIMALSLLARLVDLWAYANGVVMEFSQPRKPTDNAFIESFNGSLRDECLNVFWFDDLTDAQKKLQAWRREHNDSRPHRSLNELSPLEFKARWAEQRSEIR